MSIITQRRKKRQALIHSKAPNNKDLAILSLFLTGHFGAADFSQDGGASRAHTCAPSVSLRADARRRDHKLRNRTASFGLFQHCDFTGTIFQKKPERKEWSHLDKGKKVKIDSNLFQTSRSHQLIQTLEAILRPHSAGAGRRRASTSLVLPSTWLRFALVFLSLLVGQRSR